MTFLWHNFLKPLTDKPPAAGSHGQKRRICKRALQQQQKHKKHAFKTCFHVLFFRLKNLSPAVFLPLHVCTSEPAPGAGPLSLVFIVSIQTPLLRRGLYLYTFMHSSQLQYPPVSALLHGSQGLLQELLLCQGL